VSDDDDDDRDDDDRDENDNGRGGDRPPQRPERRKYKTKPENGDVVEGRHGDDFRRQQNVVRGQFIRVNVNHCAVIPPASPEPERKSAARSREQPTSGKPAAVSSCGPSSPAAIGDRLWSTADYDRLDGRYEQHRRSSRPSGGGGRTRSRSTGPGRRQQNLQLVAPVHQPPVPPPVTFSRYPPNVEQSSSFGTRFFGKLREMTVGNQDVQPVTFRRRNSVGESVTANFYQYFGHNYHHHHHQQQQQQQQHHHHGQYQQQQQQQQQNYQRQQVKNGGNLKSVIKKNNKSQPYQHAYDEPKKVTFSAYATVQVVD